MVIIALEWIETLFGATIATSNRWETRKTRWRRKVATSEATGSVAGVIESRAKGTNDGTCTTRQLRICVALRRVATE